MKGLTLKEQAFVQGSVQTRKPSQTAALVYNTKNPYGLASETLSKPHIKSAMSIELERAGITDSLLASKVHSGLDAKYDSGKDNFHIQHRYLNTALAVKGHLDKRIKIDKRVANINLDVKVRNTDKYATLKDTLNSDISALQQD